MKDCCKTGEEGEPRRGAKWFRWFMYGVLLFILAFACIQQLRG